MLDASARERRQAYRVRRFGQPPQLPRSTRRGRRHFRPKLSLGRLRAKEAGNGTGLQPGFARARARGRYGRAVGAAGGGRVWRRRLDSHREGAPGPAGERTARRQGQPKGSKLDAHADDLLELIAGTPHLRKHRQRRDRPFRAYSRNRPMTVSDIANALRGDDEALIAFRRNTLRSCCAPATGSRPCAPNSHRSWRRSKIPQKPSG
jgi:hypothetical protein